MLHTRLVDAIVAADDRRTGAQAQMMVVKSTALLVPVIALAVLSPVGAVALGCFVLVPIIQALRIGRILRREPWRKTAVSSGLVRLTLRDLRLDAKVLDGPLVGRRYLGAFMTGAIRKRFRGESLVVAGSGRLVVMAEARGAQLRLMHVPSEREIGKIEKMNNQTKAARNRRRRPQQAEYLLSGFDSQAGYVARRPTWTPVTTCHTVLDATTAAERWLTTQSGEACVEVIARRAAGMTVIRVVAASGVEDVTPNGS